MSKLNAPLLSLLAGVSLLACTPSENPKNQHDTAYSEQQGEAINDWFEARYEEDLARSPMLQTYYGQSDNNDRLDDNSDLAAEEYAAIEATRLVELKKQFDPAELDAQSALSYRLYEFATEDSLAAHDNRYSTYVFQHMGGPHTSLPTFMINYHTIDSPDDARAYIKRLLEFDTYLGNAMTMAEKQLEAGVATPRFVYAKVKGAAGNIIKGAPFEDGEDSPLLKDFTKKVNALDIDDAQKTALIDEAKTALLNTVKPTYDQLIAMFDRHEALSSTDDGIWKIPNGDAYYQARLKHYTTTDLTADEIHEIGLKDVARIHDEMREIMTQVEFEGTLQEFFTHLRTDPQFTFSNDDEGREAYIKQATEIIDEMRDQLDELFITKPKADVIVKRVEPFREATAFGAFYNQPALDGSRPGTYYINLKDMSELPIYQMQALAYHEGIPGHHMQIAIGMELEGLPKFRTLGGHTPYIEGWALYSESVPKEMGLYTDPYQDFGRLSMEIFRSARLVLDTGIHHKKWTREQAVEYMMNNTANSEGDIRAEIDRYIVWPGQATAYKIGMIKIQDLRQRAETELGNDFDLREFHDVILANGSVPLAILEELVEQWIETKKSD